MKKKINTISKIFKFCKNDYNSAVNTHFRSWSNFNIFANFGLLRTNDGAFESSHQGGFVFCHLAGGRNNYKKLLFVEDKQTVPPYLPGQFMSVCAPEWCSRKPIFFKLVLTISTLCSPLWKSLWCLIGFNPSTHWLLIFHLLTPMSWSDS